MKARIIQTNSHLYEVKLENNTKIQIKPQGKIKLNTNKIKAGDIVEVKDNQIIKIYGRKNELVRPPVANIDYIYIVISAKEPDFSFYLLDLYITYVLSKNIKVKIVITKFDLIEDKKTFIEDLKYYKDKLNIDIYYSDLFFTDITFEENTINVLMGQTGAGKSSLLNKLNNNLNLKTDKISKALNRGKHTTRNINFYEINNSYIADTPGFSSLNLEIERKELKTYFPEFNIECQFKDCLHLENSKGCKVKENKKIKSTRYENYLKLYHKLGDKKWH